MDLGDHLLANISGLGDANQAPKRKPTLTFFSSECFQIMPFADGLRIAHSFRKLA
jgi:hypothetical protein